MGDRHDKLHAFAGRLVMVGFGSIGQGVLPLLLRHIEMSPRQLLIVTPGDDGGAIARAHGVAMLDCALTPDNFRALLEPRLGPGDFLLNLSVDVSSTALIALCDELGALYLDTVIEPWAGVYDDGRRPPSARTNYALRESALALRRDGTRPTAVLTHGANPGLVSHFVKRALLDIARDTAHVAPRPATREDWARLSQALGVRVIHIAERDTQFSAQRKAVDEFVNTWSVDGFVGEGMQPAELGWGSHERHFPGDGARHASGSRAAIYLQRPGASTRVRSWTPAAGAQHAFLITHAESISIADHLTLGDPASPAYRPTVHYAYHPCDDAVLSVHELAGRNWQAPTRKRIVKDDIVGGVDALGVLLMGHARGAYWYGSTLSIERARQLCPHNSATSLQVTAAVMAGVVWAMRNPWRGIVEPDDLPCDELLPWCRPYLGDVRGVYTDWTPLAGRGRLFDEDVDADDPWQFKNFRVT
ncbi:saccharopine dehydrogenase C-terminal domain-containing protein [Azohydromonas sp.]|uniref:homospermidine synthase n=1 Tax=Azohydromonas sp. TaxID=1872666 RepID=UPI002CB7E50A|nr:saccharopine dehydrogenase C-terminal domain-containing protein [Azohydromonas sp.]HMM85968.1 saccharopine dehydrogenase C-terminal domain-containing protein [Azohydromonas sp.]